VSGADHLSNFLSEERRQSGLVYTPPHIVDFVIAQAEYGVHSWGPLLDPACGCGAFLEGAVRVIARSTIGRGSSRREFLECVEGELFGVDIDSKACALATAAVRHAVKEASPGRLKPSFFSRNVACGDFLTADLAKATGRHEFAFVVGNPPYVSATRLDAERKLALREHFSTAAGRLDLYTVFIERAVRLLAPRGRGAFITPDKFLVSQSASSLRSFLIQATSVRVIARFSSHKVFAGAATVPCVSVVERSRSKNAVTLLQCDADERPTPPIVRVTSRASVPQSTLTRQPWYLAAPSALKLARKLQAGCHSLNEVTLRVSAGPATGRDRVFVFRRGSEPGIEPALIRPAVRGRDVESYGITDPGLDIILPYTYDKAGQGTLVDLEKFPGAARYLTRHRDELKSRHCVRVWKKPWHDIHDHATVDLARLKKLLVPDVANSNRFAVDEGRFLPLHSAYYIIPAPGVDPHFLCGLLNSHVASFFVRVFSPVVKDGFNRYRQQFLAEIPIPIATPGQQREIAAAACRRDAAMVNSLVSKLFRISRSDASTIRSTLGDTHT
jgi:adenine-specific DNA-methyltransferase